MSEEQPVVSETLGEEPPPSDAIAPPAQVEHTSPMATATATRKPVQNGSEPSYRLDAPVRTPDALYEWQILIQAPFAFDFFRTIRSIFRLPAKAAGGPAADGSAAPPSRRSYYLHVIVYNLARLSLILGMIPFTMLAFSYVATLPFVGMRALSAAIGSKPATGLAGMGLVASLMIPVVIILQWFRPSWLRDSYKKSKVELFNIGIAGGLFLAGGMLETLIASPDLPISRDFEGPTYSTPQWTLFFADLSMNVLFANLPQKLFKGSISDISAPPHGGSTVSLGLLRLLMIVGFVTLVRLGAMKLCINKTELFYGTESELRAYLPYCGRAEARVVRRIITLMPEEEIVIRNKYKDEPVDDDA